MKYLFLPIFDGMLLQMTDELLGKGSKHFCHELALKENNNVIHQGFVHKSNKSCGEDADFFFFICIVDQISICIVRLCTLINIKILVSRGTTIALITVLTSFSRQYFNGINQEVGSVLYKVDGLYILKVISARCGHLKHLRIEVL